MQRRSATVVLLALGCACAPREVAPTPATTPVPRPTVHAPVPAPVPDPVPAIAEAPTPEPPPTLPDGTPILPCETPPPGMSCIPGGPFIRGTEDGPPNTRPQATIWLQTFYMDVDEVTNEQYIACRKTKKCLHGGPLYNDFHRPLQPITGISWFAAVRFCEVAGKRLPTEAQWEKAARGPDGALYPWGDEPVTCERAVIMDERGRSCGVKKKREHPDNGRTFEIGSRPAGIYGLRDMIGNAWEWVYDWSSKDWARCGEACAGIDPQGPCGGKLQCKAAKERVVRGGSWYWPASYATGAYRRTHDPKNEIANFHHFGFRCSASVEQARALAAASAEQGGTIDGLSAGG